MPCLAAALGARELETLADEARRMDLDQVLEYALGGEE
jgi:hypothetical protein